MASNRLAEKRTAAGVSQSALAREMGVATSTVCRWERGEREMGYKALRTLSERFTCTVEHLLGWDRPESGAA